MWCWSWPLYEVSTDRSETRDVADAHPDVVKELAAEWQRWAERVGVIPFEVTLNLYRERGLTHEEAAG